MNLRQAAQQALEALDGLHAAYRRAVGLVDRSHDDSITIAAHNAGASLRAAIAEPENQSQSQIDTKVNPAEPESKKQKPVAWIDGRGFIASHADSFPRGTTVSPLYAHPPTPRKPLTDEEIEALWQNTSPYYDHQDFARAIERKHGIGEQHE